MFTNHCGPPREESPFVASMPELVPWALFYQMVCQGSFFVAPNRNLFRVREFHECGSPGSKLCYDVAYPPRQTPGPPGLTPQIDTARDTPRCSLTPPSGQLRASPS